MEKASELLKQGSKFEAAIYQTIIFLAKNDFSKIHLDTDDAEALLREMDNRNDEIIKRASESNEDEEHKQTSLLVLNEIKENIHTIKHSPFLVRILKFSCEQKIKKQSPVENPWTGVKVRSAVVSLGENKNALQINHELRQQKINKFKDLDRNHANQIQSMLTTGHVFISYVRENIEQVLRLVHDLDREGIKVWVDRHKIKPGTKWRNAIRSAIEEKAFFIACFSNEYSSRDTTYMDEELEVVYSELKLYPDDTSWFLPIKFNKCNLPEVQINDTLRVEDIQWVEMDDNWNQGIEKILTLVSSARKPYPVGGNKVILDCDIAFSKRISQAVNSWVQQGRGTNGLITGKAFFACKCWAIKNEVYNPNYRNYSENTHDFLNASESLNGGDEGWIEHLYDHIACELCRENYRLENIQISLRTMMYICPGCASQHTDEVDEIVG